MPLKVNLLPFAGPTIYSKILPFSDHHFCMHATDHSIVVFSFIPRLAISRQAISLLLLCELRFLGSLYVIEGQYTSYCGTYPP